MQPTPAPSSPPNSPPPTKNEPIEYPEPPKNVDSAPFRILVGLFIRLQSERKQERRKQLIRNWFQHWRDEKGHDLYPVLRLLLPQKDRERAVYGLKEKNLAKAYGKLMGLDSNHEDVKRLSNWKRPTENEKTSGDFPTVLFEVVSKRSSVVEGSLSVKELNEILDELSKCGGKQDAQSNLLQRVYNRTTPEEQRWIIRIILKDMVISVKETTIFSVFHPDAQDLYNTCSDLKKVAWELWDPSRRLREEDKAVKLFSPFAPMLCKRPTKTIEGTVREMGGSKFIIEEKLDGERMQLHKRGNEYFYCSRKGKDYTYLYGSHAGTGSLTPYIDKAFDEGVEEMILDGEMLVWDPVSQRNLPFGTLKTAALVKVFDLLYIDNLSLIERSTKFRKETMKKYLKEVKGRIEFTVEWEGRTPQDVRDRMDEVMEARGEGLVIKHPKAQYVLNGRNLDWIKVKPEYMDNMGETVDVLVVAGNYGSGSRGGGVSTLICAVRDDQVTDVAKYRTFVRIGSGLTFAQYFLQTAAKSHDDKGDVYLLPEDSFILKVKAAEIVQSDQYHMNYTMRFPRAVSIRDDLTIEDCMTAKAVLECRADEKKRKLDHSDTGPAKKKMKTAPKKAQLQSGFGGQRGLKDVKMSSDIFGGTTFVVLSDMASRTREEDNKQISIMIKSHGGIIASSVARKQSPPLVVYGGTKRSLEIKNLIDKGIYDIIKPQWIKDSIALGQPAPFHKKYFFHATQVRIDDREYNEDEDEEMQLFKDEEMNVDQDEKMNVDKEAGPSGSKFNDEEEDRRQAQIKAEDLDPTIADWFKVDEDDKNEVVPIAPPDSDTENDSDNADVANEDDDEDDWMQVKNEAEPEEEPVEVIRMGETETAMEYDQASDFHAPVHFRCFYLDSPSNARKNGMDIKAKKPDAIQASFDEISKLITENGGKVVDLNEPKLTHIIIDTRDESRRVQLGKRTEKPKRRHLVISEFIQACLDEGTLLNEEEF
ncbi:DNA ligase 4 [Roridomyces roridus]|uniref:DNA ligase n=1 Tax=Roridomyces roridus TaxID=1738132 RepID=A0AAD7BJS5_9AGAR|nr:DNA ligase 4 [Roridomyces roridus]